MVDLDRAYLLLSICEKAAAHGPKYHWLANIALEELNAMAEKQDQAEDDNG